LKNFPINNSMKKIFILMVVAFVFSSCLKEKHSDEAGQKMQNFVCKISTYARSIDPDFIIIPQNGIELAYNNLDPAEGLNESYMNAIDGFGVEELFYNGTYKPDGERLPMLQELKNSKKIFVSEFISDDTNIEDAIFLNTDEGFVCFPRSEINYDYLLIPDSIQSENSEDITSVNSVQNYLYLISTDNFESKAEMLNAIAETNYDLIIMDLYFNEFQLSKLEVERLKTKANGGKRLVIAYMNVGSAENFRYYWKDNWGLHHPLWLKRRYSGYKDEFWVKFWISEWQEIIYGNPNSYTSRILDSGFDGAYLDNVEAYYFLYYRD